ncbi:hypothetical protein HDU97_001395 [Phlyctochytrium planicorne]|nr:hypothetical protein HDU97_001395 [Phlyctochytrium planicorne]
MGKKVVPEDSPSESSSQPSHPPPSSAHGKTNLGSDRKIRHHDPSNHHDLHSLNRPPSKPFPSNLFKFISSLVSLILSVPEIPPPKSKKLNDSRDRFKSGLLDPDNDISQFPKSENDNDNDDDLELQDEYNPFAAKEGIFTNTDNRTLRRYLHVPSLRFRSSRLEELYLRNMILPNRVIQLRAFAILTLMFFVYYATTIGKAPRPIHFVFFFAFGFVQCVVSVFLASYKSGKLLVSLYVNSTGTRLVVAFLELYTLINTIIFDMAFIVDSDISDGSLGTIAVLAICLTTGLSSTFLESILGLILILITATIKAYLISVKNGYKAVIYLAPFLICLILVSDLIFVGDRDRRIRFLKTQIIGTRLKGIQEENMKTEYLLGLTLPLTIVKKLKEVGTGNFDLIAERVENASVMFTDLKNYKQIQNNLGSTREAVSLLNAIFQQMDEIRLVYQGLERIKTINSKVLIVGGLSKSDHLFMMLDMALALRTVFDSPLMYDLGGGDSEVRKTPVKLDVAFGIQIGPLVAGIVGKKTFNYEVYGDVVNTASRMLSLASGGEIIITPQVYDLCHQEFETKFVGEKAVKGKGVIKIYSVISRRDPAELESAITSHHDSNRSSFNRRRSTLRSVKDHTQFVKTLKMMSGSIATPSRRKIDKTILNSAWVNAQSVNHPNRPTSPSQSVFVAGQVPGLATSSETLTTTFSGSGEKRSSKGTGMDPTNPGNWRSAESVLSDESHFLSDPALEMDMILEKGAQVAEMMMLPNVGGVDRKPSNKRPPTDLPPPVVSIPLPKGTEFTGTNLTKLQEIPSNSFLNQIEDTSRQSEASKEISLNPPQPKQIGRLPPIQKDSITLDIQDQDDENRQQRIQQRNPSFASSTTPTFVIRSSSQKSREGYDYHDSKSDEVGFHPSVSEADGSLGVSVENCDRLESGSDPKIPIEPEQETERPPMSDDDNQKILSHLMKTMENKGIDAMDKRNAKRGAWSWKMKGVEKSALELTTKHMKTVEEKGGDSEAARHEGPDGVEPLPMEVKKEAIWSTTALMDPKGFRATGSGGQELQIIKNTLNSALRFSNPALEKRFSRDYNKSTWTTYLGRASRGIACQLILIGLALFNVQFIDLYEILCDSKRGDCTFVNGEINRTALVLDAGGYSAPEERIGIEHLVWADKATVIWTTFVSTGPQILLTGLNLLDSSSSPGPIFRLILVFWSITSFAIITFMISLKWSNLFGYRLMTTIILPQVMVVNALTLDGMEFGWRSGIAFLYMIGTAVINGHISQQFFNVMLIVPEILAAVLISLTWVLIFSIRETNVRIEYLLDLILITQSDMVKDEMTKSSRVLSTILPQRVTLKLLGDPTSLVYEEFNCITVLHMDIAGLTEEFNVEKITTIGDAYVASSSLSREMDKKIAAISVCIVALQMQAFVVQQLNTSPMMLALNQTLSMRIGLHTGPAYGAIMGGEKNFRYDLLGDTVLIAEKIQEITPLASVSISDYCWELVKDYHGFETVETDHKVMGDTIRVYGVQGNRGLTFGGGH